MSEENKSTGFFGILEKYIMNPLGKLATTKFVRAIRIRVLPLFHLPLLGQCSWY